jgi:hypothetical protein
VQDVDVSMFLVTLHRSGPLWDSSLSMDEQVGWGAHAAYMDELVAQGFVVLGGPLSDDIRVLLAVESPSPDLIREVLARDPWGGSHLKIYSIEPWTIRLDGRQS